MAYKSKKDQSLASKRHYEANKVAVKNRAALFKRLSRVRNKNFIKEFLLKNPCVDCGESDIVVLEFDHIGTNKVDNISTGSANGWSLGKLIMEIEKCVVRCANCHRRITYKRRLANLNY